MSPHTAWLILQGIETLPLRMERHMPNTQKIVEILAAHLLVVRVGHPLLASPPSTLGPGTWLYGGPRALMRRNFLGAPAMPVANAI